MAQGLPSTPYELALFTLKAAEEYLSKQDEALHRMVSQNNLSLVNLRTHKVEFIRLFDYWKICQINLERVADQRYLSTIKGFANLYKNKERKCEA